MIDILSVEPHKVSRDLSGYLIYIYGVGGTGKTTLASQMDKALLLAFERGYNAIPGVKPQDMTSWSDMKQVVRQLNQNAAKEMYKSICIDTIDIAADACEKYICNRENVEKLADIAWGGGYKMMKKEFEEVFRTIAQMGYALFFISHAKDKTFKRENGTEYNQIIPSLAPSTNEIIRNMVDLQGYAHPVQREDGTSEVMLTLRCPDNSIECKSRFKMIAPEIRFSYEDLSNALTEAIDKEAEDNNGAFVTDSAEIRSYRKEYDFEGMMAEFKDLTHKIQENVDEDEFKSKWAPKIISITDKYLGKGKKVNDCTEAQCEQLELILMDLKDEVAKGL